MTNVTSSYRNYRYVRLVCWLVFGFLVWFFGYGTLYHSHCFKPPKTRCTFLWAYPLKCVIREDYTLCI